MPSPERQPSHSELVRNAEERVRRLYGKYQSSSGAERRRHRRRVELAIARLRELRSKVPERRDTQNRFRDWYSSLSTGVRTLVAVVIAAGAVATAIGAIGALWPDPPAPTAELKAELSELLVDEPVTLEEYTIRHDELEGSSAPSPMQHRHTAALTVPLPTQPALESETTKTETTTTDTTGTETTETETTETDTTGTESVPTTEEDDDPTVVVPDLSDEARERLREGVRRALGQGEVAAFSVGEACASGLGDPECGLSSTALFMKLGEDASAPEVAENLTEVLEETRTVETGSGTKEPVGATVNYRISMTGFNGREVDVRWELHRPEGPILPHKWLKNQRAGLLRGEAEKDSATPYFWIPLPDEPGPFVVRLIALDEDGDRIAQRDTDPFE